MKPGSPMLQGGSAMSGGSASKLNMSGIYKASPRFVVSLMSVVGDIYDSIMHRSRGSPRPLTPRLALPDSSHTVETVHAVTEMIKRASEGSLPVNSHNVAQFISVMHHALGEWIG